jgi:hypothetical protein
MALRLTTSEDEQPRSYANAVFFRDTIQEGSDYRSTASPEFTMPTFMWDTPEFRTLIIVVAFAAYPAVKGFFFALPPPNATEVKYLN